MDAPQILADDLILATSRLTGRTFFAGLIAVGLLWVWPLAPLYVLILPIPFALALLVLAVGLARSAISEEGRTRSFLPLCVISLALAGPVAAIGVHVYVGEAACALCLAALAAKGEAFVKALAVAAAAFMFATPLENVDPNDLFSPRFWPLLHVSHGAATLLLVSFRVFDTRGNWRLFGAVSFLAGAFTLAHAAGLGVWDGEVLSAIGALLVAALGIARGFRDSGDTPEPRR